MINLTIDLPGILIQMTTSSVWGDHALFLSIPKWRCYLLLRYLKWFILIPRPVWKQASFVCVFSHSKSNWILITLYCFVVLASQCGNAQDDCSYVVHASQCTEGILFYTILLYINFFRYALWHFLADIGPFGYECHFQVTTPNQTVSNNSSS